MRCSGKLVAAGAAIWMGASLVAASAQPSRCYENGDIVTFDGIASAEGSGSQWLLNLDRPICVAWGRRGVQLSILRIIGEPPPLGIPLELMGKLMLGRSAADSEIYVALVVIRGRKLRAPERRAAPPSPPAPARSEPAPVPKSAPARTAEPASAPRPVPKPKTVPAPQAAPPPQAPPTAPTLLTPPSAPWPPPAAAPQNLAKMRGAENCSAPPYGGTPAAYRSFVQRFGKIVKPEKILADVCNAKFGNASRDQLHRLGLTDAKIDSENTEQLAEDTIAALKNLVNKLQ